MWRHFPALASWNSWRKICGAVSVKQNLQFSSEIGPGRDMASGRREDAAARRFDNAQVKGSRSI